MNVLLVEARPREREALAAYLVTRGHRVHAGTGVDEALRALRDDEFDAVVTAWHLGADDASAIVASSHGPCVVLAPSAGEVVGHPAIAAVLVEPVAPSAVSEVLRGLAEHRPACCSGHPDNMPLDTCDRVRVVLALLDDAEQARVEDDGSLVTIEGHLRDPERWVALLDGIGGDLRVVSGDGDEASFRLLLTLDRRGWPAGVELAVSPEDPWPAGRSFAIDFHGSSVTPDGFLVLCDRVRRAWREGREIHLVNVPSHLRICLEAVGRGDDLPMRRPSGPRLPQVLGEPWR